jgi:hypothetical protein
MTNQNPITPPPELVAKWASSMCGYYEAAQWSADQELDACCEWLKKNTDYHITIEFLRDARRPKPPSLKEEARQIIDCLIEGDCLNDDDAVTLRRVVEALND